MRIVWTKFARADIQAIRAYIARDSARYAEAIVRRITGAATALKRFPELGQVVPQFRRHVVRERIIHSYRLLYSVYGDRIVILAVIHAARDIDTITLPESD